MTGRWFRFYDSVVDDPKVQRLSDAAFRAWVNLMCVASKNGGYISPDFGDIAFALRTTEAKARALLQTLLAAELLEEIADGFQPHNWGGRQYASDSAAERQKRYREKNKNRNGDGDGDVKSDAALRNARRNSDAVEEEVEQNRVPLPKGNGRKAADLFPEPARPVRVDPWKEVYDRGKAVLGREAGGIITNLRKTFDDKPRKVLAKIEDAAEMRNPIEWINAFLFAHGPPGIEVGAVHPIP